MNVVTMRFIMIAIIPLAVSSSVLPQKKSYALDVDETLEILKDVYHHINIIGSDRNFVLILGDLDGIPSEVGQLLSGSKPTDEGPAHKNGYSILDVRENTTVIDLPMFNNEREDTTSLIADFINKLVFDKIQQAKFILVVPDNIDSQTRKFTDMVSKLIKIIDSNFDADYFKSVGVICAISANSTSTDRKANAIKTIKNLIRIWRDASQISYDYALLSTNPTIGGKNPVRYLRESNLMKNLFNRDSYVAFQRSRENVGWDDWGQDNMLQNFVANEMNYTTFISKRKKPVVSNYTRNFVFENKHVLVNESKMSIAETEMIRNLVAELRHLSSDNPEKLKTYISNVQHNDASMLNIILSERDEYLFQDVMFEIEKFDLVQKLTEEFSSNLRYVYSYERLRNLRLAYMYDFSDNVSNYPLNLCPFDLITL